MKTNKNFHDRFVVIDYETNDEKIYLLGSSINDTGKKISVINSFEDKELLKPKIEETLVKLDTILN